MPRKLLQPQVSLTLRLHDPQWVRNVGDDPTDLCAHGRVEFCVDDAVFVRPEDGVWTVSAAGLFLLRSTQADHPLQGATALTRNYLFPCCGFTVFLQQGRLAVPGCPSGADVAVLHEGGRVQLRTATTAADVTAADWRAAVLGFAREVEAFYARSAPKAPAWNVETQEGWAEFWREWRERVQALAVATG